MNRVFKTILLWILIAALPAQGMAAAINASCGPNHHDEATGNAMMSVVHHEAMAAAHEYGDNTAARHHHGHADAGLVPDMHYTDSPSVADASLHAFPDAKHIHKTSSCSTCAACCFGAAAPLPTVACTPVPAGMIATVIPPVVLFTGHIPAGLERPPRHPSA